MDFEGNGTIDATLSVPVAGTYQFTAPTLADGTYTDTATFKTATAGNGPGSTTYTIDTDGPHVTAMSPTGTVGTSVSQVTVTFSEPVDLSTFTPSAITLTGPAGTDRREPAAAGLGQHLRHQLPAARRRRARYTLTIAPSVSDLAGNEMDQNQNGVNGEPDDSFTGSFTIALPDLAVTATQAPSSALLGSQHPRFVDGHERQPDQPGTLDLDRCRLHFARFGARRLGHPPDQRRCAPPVAARPQGRATRAMSRSPFRASLDDRN